MNDYNPFDPATIADPYPAYQWLRNEAPVFHNAEHDIWAISRFADVYAALRDYTTYSSEQGVGSEYRPVPMLIAQDPPDHTRLRRIVQREFIPKAIASWQPKIEALVDDLVGNALEADGPVDWVDAVATPLPVWVIMEMLGLPHEDRPQVKRWSDATMAALGGRLDDVARGQTEAEIIAFAEYLFTHVQAERAAPSDNLMAHLLSPRSGEVLTNDELVSFVMLLTVAGNETTTNLLAGFVALMAQYPEQWDILRARPTLIANAIEEILRYESPIQGFFRTTAREVALHGETIPEGAKVMMLYASANRDEAAFAAADRFDVRREVSNHLAFGAGIHLCLGAPLARLEAVTLVRVLVERVARFELVGPGERAHNPLLRGWHRLPVRLIPAD